MREATRPKSGFQADFKALVSKRFDHVEQHLANREYLLAGGFSIADAYLFVTTGWCGYVDIDLQKWPALVAFRKRIRERLRYSRHFGQKA